MFSAATLVLSGVCLAVTLTVSHALLRSSADLPSYSLPWAVRVVIALGLYGAVFIAYTWLLRKIPMSSLYPLYTALSVMGVALTGHAFFGEALSVQSLAGIALILCGVWLVASGTAN